MEEIVIFAMAVIGYRDRVCVPAKGKDASVVSATNGDGGVFVAGRRGKGPAADPGRGDARGAGEVRGLSGLQAHLRPALAQRRTALPAGLGNVRPPVRMRLRPVTTRVDRRYRRPEICIVRNPAGSPEFYGREVRERRAARTSILVGLR